MYFDVTPWLAVDGLGEYCGPYTASSVFPIFMMYSFSAGVLPGVKMATSEFSEMAVIIVVLQIMPRVQQQIAILTMALQ